jgi:hypothetical protein
MHAHEILTAAARPQNDRARSDGSYATSSRIVTKRAPAAR